MTLCKDFFRLKGLTSMLQLTLLLYGTYSNILKHASVPQYIVWEPLTKSEIIDIYSCYHLGMELSNPSAMSWMWNKVISHLYFWDEALLLFSTHCGLLYSNTQTIGIKVRVFASCLGDWGSIQGRVIPKTQKWYLLPLCLTLNFIRYRSRVSGGIQRKN